jgi:SAM-dependent methyltransferase
MKTALRFVVGGLIRLTILGLSTGPHLSRYAMYQRLEQFRMDARPNQRALSISGSVELCQLLGFDTDQITEADHPEFNLLELPFKDSSFDVVVSDQVLEHVEADPRRAVAESLRVVKPGGICVHTSCLINPIHFGPGDYWRFTPDGLRLLVDHTVEVMETGGWGNRFAVIALAMGLRMAPIPHLRIHPLHWLAVATDSKWLISTWIVLRKPLPQGTRT